MEQNKCESKYERIRRIGIGSYGIVFKCVNRQTGQIVAIKRYSENDSDPMIRKIAMREVKVLRQLKHPNLINLIEVFRRKRRLHLVFDYCELTVLDVIEKYGNSCPLNLIRKIVWQIVNGTSYCHSRNYIHRDIKPENILINQSGIVKLCDFGFARSIDARQSQPGALHHQQLSSTKQSIYHDSIASNPDGLDYCVDGGTCKSDEEDDYSGDPDKSSSCAQLKSDRQALTEYVATRWYRAPELLIGEIYYDAKIDIWAIGCVTAELMRGDPIWPGKTDLDQLFIIKNSLGNLTQAQTDTLLSRGIYDQENIDRLLDSNLVSERIESVESKLPARIGDIGIDFVSVCLQMNPDRRPTCEQLLRHEYIHSARMTQFMKTTTATGAVSVSNGKTHMTLAPISESPASNTVQNTKSYKQSHIPHIQHRSNSQSVLLATSKSPINCTTQKKLQQQHQSSDWYGKKQESPLQKKVIQGRDLNNVQRTAAIKLPDAPRPTNAKSTTSLVPVAKNRSRSLGYAANSMIDITTKSTDVDKVCSPVKPLDIARRNHVLKDTSENKIKASEMIKGSILSERQNFETFNRGLMDSIHREAAAANMESKKNNLESGKTNQQVFNADKDFGYRVSSKISSNLQAATIESSASSSTTISDSNRLPVSQFPSIFHRVDNQQQSNHRNRIKSGQPAKDFQSYGTSSKLSATRQLTRQISRSVENACC